MHTWTVPGYTEIRELGSAGPGRTVLARHTASGVEVTIHYLTGDDRDPVDYRERARRLVALDSPFVAGVYDYVESADGAATVHEYVDGAGLPALLAARRLRRPAALTVLNGVFAGLAAARAGTVDAVDVTPDRVRVTRHGQPKLTATDTPVDDPAAALAELVAALRPALPRTMDVNELAADPARPGATWTGATWTGATWTGADWAVKGREQLARAVRRVS